MNVRDGIALNPEEIARASGFVSGNQVTLLQNSEAFLPALEQAMGRAGFEIYLVTYIFADDSAGRRIASAMKRAVLRGVRVYLIVDGYGSSDLSRHMRDQMQQDGIRLHVFRPWISPWTLRRKRLRRMHRKIAVIDRETAFVGGINIVDDGLEANEDAPRYDYAVAIEGPLVDSVRHSAVQLWASVAGKTFRSRGARAADLPESTRPGGSMRAAFLLRDNLRHRRDIESAYLLAISHARTEIILAHAYFFPGHKFRRALINAAKRGVRVVLLLQGKLENFLEHHARRAIYGNLLAAGIEIHEYQRSYLHAKVAVVDGHWATVGSSNIDPFSLLLSCEANIVVDDSAFGSALAQSLKISIALESQQIVEASWNQQSIAMRFINWLCYGLVRLMTEISGYDSD
ncbi:MAG: cardiolipin synthase ClsB [Planctomyces sp.]|nr:cardiolipin synthase ClsB [Planctomyces sp.]